MRSRGEGKVRSNLQRVLCWRTEMDSSPTALMGIHRAAMPVRVREVRAAKPEVHTPCNVGSQGVNRAHPKSKPLGRFCHVSSVGRLTCFQRPPLLAGTAKSRPGHGFQSRLGDGPLAGVAHAEPALPNPSQCLFDGSQQVTVALAEMDLEAQTTLQVHFSQ